MSDFVVVETSTGRCIQVHRSQESCSTSHLRSGTYLVEVAEGFDDANYYFNGTTPVAFPYRPSHYHLWDWSLKTWIDPRTEQQIEVSIASEIVKAVQLRLDTFARTRNYDGILSACTYATSAVSKFSVEGQYCVLARDTTWATLYAILAEVTSRMRAIPHSYSEIESELPPLVWPSS